jgi:hypothetical protein
MTLKHEKTKQVLHLLWYMLLWLHSDFLFHPSHNSFFIYELVFYLIFVFAYIVMNNCLLKLELNMY